MRKKKIAFYLTMIVSLLALSVVTPLIIGSISSHIAEKIRGRPKEEQSETPDTEPDTDGEGMATISAEADKPEDTSPSGQGKTPRAGEKKAAGKESDPIIRQEVSYYDEPVYKTQEEEDAANARAYQDMTEKLKALSEAAMDYRERFDPAYDELKPGIMNAFIAGREGAFYEAIADYCFGRYNTTKVIALVRFDAVTEDTEEKTTVILELFSADEVRDDTRIPSIAYCSYNKTTDAFIFYECGG